MKLFHKTIGAGQPLIILHGLMGMLDNWSTLGKRFASSHQVFLLDQRNHGRSEHSDDFNYDLLVEDLLEFIEENELEQIKLIGHSMGGKVAMKFAQNYPEFISKLIVADIGPKHYPVHHETILTALNSIDLTSVNKRSEADLILQQSIDDFGQRQFLLKNLYWIQPGKLAWRFNLPSISKNIEEVGKENYDFLCNTDTLFIYGGNSNYIALEDINTIPSTFPNSSFYNINEAGHWLHAQKPDEFYKVVNEFINT